MSEDINPLAPAEDAVQEEAEAVEAEAEAVTPAAEIPAWAVMPDGGRTGGAPVAEEVAEESVLEAEAPVATEYDGARAHSQVDVRFNQGT